MLLAGCTTAVEDGTPWAAQYARATTLEIERLEQSYERLTDSAVAFAFRYDAPSFRFRCDLVVDSAGLALDYPGIATRAL